MHPKIPQSIFSSLDVTDEPDDHPGSRPHSFIVYVAKLVTRWGKKNIPKRLILHKNTNNNNSET